MPALCLGGTKLERLATGAKIVKAPRPFCEVQRYVYVDFFFKQQYAVNVHNHCLCNEYVSLYNRHLIDRRTPEYSPKYIFSKFKIFQGKLNITQLPRVPYYQIIKNYHGGKRAVYMRAAEYLKNNFLQPKHTTIKMFVKPDKYAVDEVHLKAPRAIQYRSPEFNLLIASYLKPIEEHIYNLPGRPIVKGLTNVERGQRIFDAWCAKKNPIAIMLDHSKFDSTVTKEHLALLHRLYLKFNRSKLFKKLLKKQIKNTGYSRGGIKYKVIGTRMSGDFDTALGNSLLNYFTLYSLFGEEAEYVIDGDDSVLIMERSAWVKYKHRLDHFRKFGFTTKFETTTELEGVEFCQLRMLATGLLVKEPVRALSHFSVSLKKYQGRARVAYIASKAEGLWHLSQRTPILYPVFEELTRLTKRRLYDDDIRMQLKQPLLGPPTEADRDAYALAFGIPVAEQIYIENALKAEVMGGIGGKQSDLKFATYSQTHAAETTTNCCIARSPEVIASSGTA